MLTRRRFSSLVMALAAFACSQSADQAAAPAVDSTAVTAALGDLWQRWIAADTTGDVAAQVEMIADSARIDVRGMPPVLGREAWRTAAEAAFKTMKVNSMTPTPDMTIPITNELVYQNGSFTEGTTMAGKSEMSHGRYALAAAKLPDGKWRFTYVMAFSDSTVPVKK